MTGARSPTAPTRASGSTSTGRRPWAGRRFAAPDRTRTQPITFARKDAPPLLLATGDVDTTVYPRNTRNLGRRLSELGAPVETIEYAGTGHAGIVVALTPLFRGNAPVLSDIVRFLKSKS